jgi:hypothetical protein
MKLNEYNTTIGIANAENPDGDFKIILGSTQEAVDYILIKKQLGLEITGADASLLSQTLWQNPKDGQLAGEFKEYVLNNADEFKAQGLNLNEKNVDAFVNRIVSNTCVLNSIYENVVLSVSPDKAYSVPQSYGDMYLTAYANGIIQKDGINMNGSVNNLQVIQKAANTISNGNFSITGATTYGGESTRQEVYNMIPSIIEGSTSGATGGRISIGNGGHNMTQLGTGVYDTGQPSANEPRDHGTEYNSNIYKPNNSQSFWTLTPDK